MITTKINVDTSELLKAFKLLESQGKLTADNIDKAFNNSLKIEVDSSDFKKIETEATTMFGKLKNNLKGSFDMSQILNFSAGGLVTGAVEKGLSLVAEGFSQAIEKGSEFEKQLNAVGAITGQSGKSLDNLGESALELSKQFGGDANTQLGAFQGILSKFGAELANTPEALNEVTKNVNLLAKASGMDATQSMNALTDAMLQFGVDTTNADEVAKESARFMNLLAASAKVGAAEIPELTASMLQVGVSAKSAGIGAEEVTGALQRLAVGGKKGSEAGIGLRNVLGLLQKQSGEGEKILEKMGLTTLKLGDSLGKDGLAKTLDLVKNGLNNFGTQTEKNQAILQLFGAENSTVAGLLLENTKQITEFTKASTGTASGLEQAKINMQGFSESMSRLKANIDAILIKSFLNIKEVITTVFDAIFIFFNNTVVPFFDTIFNSIGEAIAPLLNEVENMYNTFMSLFDGIGGGVDILGTLRIVFETLGSVIGTIIQIALQPSLLILRSLVKVYTLLYEGVGIAIDYFKKLASQGTLVGDFLKFIKDGFFALIDVIKKTVGFVGGLLEKFGLIKKDKPVDNLNKDLKETAKTTEEVKTNIEGTTKGIEGNTNATKKQKAEVKTLQQEYDELYKKTLEIADNSKFKLQYDANLIKLQKFKDEIEGNNVLKMKVDFDLQGGITWDDRNKLINDYLKNDVEVEEVAIRPKELTFALKNIKPIVIENAKLEPTFFETLEKDIASRIEKTVNGITLNFNNDSYKQAIKELNSETQSELDNLSNSLMSANISYEEYSEQKADILRNAKEKEMQIENEHQSNLFSNINNSTSALMQSIKEQYDNNFNDTLARTTANNIKIIEAEKVKNQALIDLENAKLANDTKLMADKQALIDESNKTIIDSTQIASDSMNSIYSTMAVSMGASLTDAIVQGKNAFDTLVGLAFDFLQKMVPIWSAQILAGSLATPQSIITAGGAGLVQWTAMTILIQGAVSAARAALGFKDGVINLQGEGTSRSDSIPAMLSKGESVINARSTAQNEPYLRFINNGGDMSKLVNMNMNTKNIENLLYTNNELLRSKNFNPSINNVNKFNVSSSSIKVVRGR